MRTTVRIVTAAGLMLLTAASACSSDEGGNEGANGGTSPGAGQDNAGGSKAGNMSQSGNSSQAGSANQQGGAAGEASSMPEAGRAAEAGGAQGGDTGIAGAPNPPLGGMSGGGAPASDAGAGGDTSMAGQGALGGAHSAGEGGEGGTAEPPLSCQGTPPECTSRGQGTSCTNISGCSLAAKPCQGDPPACNYWNQFECPDAPGCAWSANTGCTGTPSNKCSDYGNSLLCVDYGCAWYYCIGTATPCSSFANDTCAQHTGCSLQFVN